MKFTDSHLLVAAWRQALEPDPPLTPVVRIDDERTVVARDVLAVLRGEKLAPDAVRAVEKYLVDVVAEAMTKVRGRFAVGLQSTVNGKEGR